MRTIWALGPVLCGKGRRSWLHGSSIIRERFAIALAKPGGFDWEVIFAGANWLHFTSITPAPGPEAAALCEEARNGKNP